MANVVHFGCFWKHLFTFGTTLYLQIWSLGASSWWHQYCSSRLMGSSNAQPVWGSKILMIVLSCEQADCFGYNVSIL